MTEDQRKYLLEVVGPLWVAEMFGLLGVTKSFEAYLDEYAYLGEDLYYSLCNDFGVLPLVSP